MTSVNQILEKKRKVYVTRKMHFNAAHRLFNPLFSDEKNEAIFDVCNNPNGHGHNYELEVTLSGAVDKDTGYLFDLKQLKALLESAILSKVDHKHLNLDVDMFRSAIPTAEVMAVTFWDILKKEIEKLKLENVSLYKIKLYETERNIVTYKGE